MAIIYKKMSLFEAEPGAYLVHSANARGVWGSGIAAEIKKRYPSQYPYYKEYASENLGSCIVSKAKKENHSIVNLVTSNLESSGPDSIEDILINTTTAIDTFLQAYSTNTSLQTGNIYSNKFNSGLFRVPWERTEAILKVLTNRYEVNWTICDPDMDDNMDGMTIGEVYD